MENKINRKALVAGVAAIASLLGTLSNIFTSRKRGHKGWFYQTKAKEMAGNMMKGQINRYYMLGGVAGSLIGITAALLLARKSGRALVKDISHSFQTKLSQASPFTRSRKKSSKRRKAPSVIQHRAAASSIQKRPSKSKRSKTSRSRKSKHSFLKELEKFRSGRE
jgi:hypothetical protein